MIFQPEAQFRQLCHCDFRENVIKMLYIPYLNSSEPIFLIVNKFGKIGLYQANSFKLIHTYVLDLMVPMIPNLPKNLLQLIKAQNQNHPPNPRCQKTHLIVDAIYASNFKSCLFLTTKGVLQCYDIGEIETQSIGLELLPRKEFMGMKYGHKIIDVKNHGHTETHRLFGLREFPTCMYYYHDNSDSENTKQPNNDDNSNSNNNADKVDDDDGGGLDDKNVSNSAADSASCNNKACLSLNSTLLIGDTEGCITIIYLDHQNTGQLFGLRKIRGRIHEIKAIDLYNLNALKVYKGHNGPVKQLLLLSPRQLILSCCSMDRKYSLFVNDLLVQSNKPYVISSVKGINTFAHSITLKMIATGSDDFIIRLFNDFITRMPQMELVGHKASIIGIEFLNVSYMKSQLLLSYSKDVELRAWDPVNFICLQSIYISFEPNTTIICKTPEFAKNCLYIHQPHYYSQLDQNNLKFNHNSANTKEQGAENKQKKNNHKQYDGEIILFYCNSMTKLWILKNTSSWPFDFEDFIDEFEETTAKYEQKILRKQQSKISKDCRKYFDGLAKQQNLLNEDELNQIETNLDSAVHELLDIKRNIDKSLGIVRQYEFEEEESQDKQDGIRKDFQQQPSKMSLSTQAMRKFHSLERLKKSKVSGETFNSAHRKSYPSTSTSTNKNYKELPSAAFAASTSKSRSRYGFIQQGIAFKSLPVYNIEPLSFSHSSLKEEEDKDKIGTKRKSLPITDTMKSAGIQNIESIHDILTPEARKYFSEENLRKVRNELKLTENTLRMEADDGQLEEDELEISYDGASVSKAQERSGKPSSASTSTRTNKSESSSSASSGSSNTKIQKRVSSHSNRFNSKLFSSRSLSGTTRESEKKKLVFDKQASESQESTTKQDVISSTRASSSSSASSTDSQTPRISTSRTISENAMGDEILSSVLEDFSNLSNDDAESDDNDGESFNTEDRT